MIESMYFYALAAGIGLFAVGFLAVMWGGLRKGFFGFVLALIPLLNLFLVTRGWDRPAIRNGFLLSIVGLLLGLVGYYGGGERELLARLEGAGLKTSDIEIPVQVPIEVPIKVDIKRPHEIEVPNQAEAEAAGVDTTRSVLDEPPIDPRDIKALPPKESKQLATRKVEYRFEPTCPALLNEDLGKKVRVLLREGGVKEGTLVQATQTSMFVEQKVSGGDVAFEYPFDQIQSLEVYDIAGRKPSRASRCIQAAIELTPPARAQ